MADVYSKKFREFSQKLSVAISAKLVDVSGELNAKGLITLNMTTEATAATGADAQRTAAKIINDLQRALHNDDDPEAFLNNVLKALKDVGEPNITKVVEKLEKAISEEIEKQTKDSAKEKKPAKRQKFDSTKGSGAGYTAGEQKDKENGHDEPDGGESLPKLPHNGDKFKPSKEISFKDIPTAVVESIKIVITPATLEEEKAVLDYLEPIEGDHYISASIYDRSISNIHVGKFGHNPVVVVTTAPPQHKQGPVHAAIVITKILEKFTSIKYIVGVGVCYGMDKNKQKLGEVIVSTILCDFTNKREGETELNNYQRGAHTNVGNSISNMFIPTDEIKSKLPKGIIADKGVYICTPSLIDKYELKEEYKDTRKDAKAGEMEGAGLTAATEYTKNKVEAIVIKGIGDWGDGDKEGTKGWKPFAAQAAACYVKTVLEIKTVVCDSD